MEGTDFDWLAWVNLVRSPRRAVLGALLGAALVGTPRASEGKPKGGKSPKRARKKGALAPRAGSTRTSASS